MLTFTLNYGITINTRYIEQIGLIYPNKDKTKWVYQIVTHRGEQLYQEFTDKRDAELNRERLIATIEAR